MITIDGSMGKGGGEVLRTALALSVASGKSFRMHSICRGHKKPGLKKLHVHIVQAAALICSAQVEGAFLGSTGLTFIPGKARSGDYVFDVGGGSCILFLLTILPAFFKADGPSAVTVTGATHAPKSPPYEFFEKTYLPLVRRLGPGLEARLNRYGFCEYGGGSITVHVTPRKEFVHLEYLGPKGTLRQHERMHLLACNLPEELIHYACEAILKRRILGNFERNDWSVSNPPQYQEWVDMVGGVQVTRCDDCDGFGNVALYEFMYEHGTTIAYAYGGKSRESADKMAKELYARWKYYCEYEGAVDRVMTEHLIVPVSLGKGGIFDCQKPTQDAFACMDAARLFTNKSIATHQRDRLWTITVEGLES